MEDSSITLDNAKSLTDASPNSFALLLAGADVFTGNGVKIRVGPPPASTASLDAARFIASSSGRRKDTPVRKSFVRSAPGTAPPLAELYAGGRSGVVAVKLYLALLWRCSSPPYSTDKPARAWATLLDLPDPEGRGTRRVKAAMKRLAELNLVTIAAQPGSPNVVTLLDEGGTTRSYALPSTSYTKAVARGAAQTRLEREVYFKVPTTLWTRGYLQRMSGPALIMLLVLLAEQGGQGKEIWISPSAFAERYGISSSTRTKGTQDLETLALLDVRQEAVAVKTQSTVFDERKRRNIYRLTAQAQDAQSADPTAKVSD